MSFIRAFTIDRGSASVRVEPPLVLAPLAGYTDRAFRALIRRLGGCGLVVTEMVSSEGLTRRSALSREMATVLEQERPVAVQIFGSDPARMADAAAIVEQTGASLVDINMGCPVPKVTRRGAGAALMQDVGRAADIVSRIAKRVRIPVTAKLRSGWDTAHINAPEVARALEEAGASAVTIHPRCRSERHRGRAAWRVIAAVKEAVAVPVIGNGDVRSPEDARAMIDETHVDAVMIGRGALKNPWLFRQIADALAGRPAVSPGVEDVGEALAFFIEKLQEYLPDKVVLNRVKALVGWLTKGMPGGAELRRRVYASRTLPEVVATFEAYFDRVRRRKARAETPLEGVRGS